MFKKIDINHSIKNIYHHIENYNEQSDNFNSIKFVHGGSSAMFSFIGREVVVHEKNGETVNKVIPNALIPTGLLRKRYGVYPVSGELEIGVFGYGSRKAAINYNYLSGVKPTYQGISEAYNYAMSSNRVPSEKKLCEMIHSAIKSIDKFLYLRSLKMLLMHMTNLMLLSKNKQEAVLFANHCIQLITDKQNQLKEENPNNQDIDKHFNKYIAKLEGIILGRELSFISDENFINNIQNQYPILLCSHIAPLDFTDGVPDEQIVRDELDLSNIKIIFVSDNDIKDIKIKLEKLGLQSIKVISFQNDVALTQSNQNQILFR